MDSGKKPETVDRPDTGRTDLTTVATFIASRSCSV